MTDSGITEEPVGKEGIGKLFAGFAHENPRLVAGHTLLTIVVPLRDIVLPLLYSRVIAAVQHRRDIKMPLAMVTCTLIAVQVLDICAEYCDTILVPRLQAYMRRSVLASLFRNDDVSDVMAGSVMTKLVKLPQVVTSLFERLSTFVLPYVILHAGTIAYLFTIDATIGTVSGAMVVFMYIMLILGMLRCNKVTMSRDAAFGELHEQIDDALHNMYSIHGSQTQASELDRIGTYESSYDKRHQAASSCVFKWRLPSYPAVVCYIVFFMSYMRMRLQRKALSLDTAVPMFFVFMYLLNSFMMLDNVLKHAVMDWGTLCSCMTLLVPRSAAKPARAQVKLPDTGIGMRNVKFSYGDRVIFQDLSLHIDSGDVVAIMGSIGSGKSTLLKLLMRYIYPDSGTVYVDGMAYDDMATATLRAYVGYVPQHAVLFNRSIYENITYGIPATAVDRTAVENLLRRVNLWDTVQAMPQGLDTLVGKNGSGLSGGQRQLVWVLRVILRNPEVLLLDEPTSSMDPETRGIMLQVLRDFFISQGKTVVMITHDTDVAAFAQTFVYVTDGRIDIKSRSRKGLRVLY